ncbi:MAG: transglycosylase SLT domain-containing protein [Acidobacteria bacterium]|nr:transglycosylase SLT domain-containing protein [Acidobacteriota bacterium]
MSGQTIRAQQKPTTPGNTYQQMTSSERTAFVAERARRIARQMAGTDYEFTPEFVAGIQKFVDRYAQRINNNGGDRLGQGDARFVFERGKTVAPQLINAFKAHNVSPLIGLYIPAIESEYVNIETPNAMGSVGMFQFLPKTGQRFGLSAQELTDIAKSADAAARYIELNLKRFKEDKMKEALALLAYNRGESAVERDLALIVNEGNKLCSICALTAERERLDSTFQKENVYYVPRFFAAAIVGENPQAFGLSSQPLSSYETGR